MTKGYTDTDEKDKEAWRLIVGALDGFIVITERKSQEWLAEDGTAVGPKWWLVTLILHALERMRAASGGQLDADVAEVVGNMARAAAEGRPLYVITPLANHGGTETVQ